MLAVERKKQVVASARRHDTDSGSPEVQVSVLTERIKEIAEHRKKHTHDFSGHRGLTMMVARRNRLLKYLARTENDRYQSLIQRLGLRK